MRASELYLAAAMTLVVVAAAVGGADIAGFLASVVAFAVWLPQARTVWRSRHDPHALAGVSVGTQILVLSNAVLWGVYATQESAFWVAAPGVINAPLALLCISLIVRARRPQAQVPSHIEPVCQHCREKREHREFITAPPGWGSVLDCTGTPRPHAVVIFTDEDARALRAHRR